MESVLSSSWYSVGYTGRMPRSDTSNLSQSLVGLSGQTSGSPSLGYSCKSVTFGYSDYIDHLVLLEDGIDGYFLFKEANGEVNLLINSSSVDLRLD